MSWFAGLMHLVIQAFLALQMPIPKVGTFEKSLRMSFSWSSLFLLFVLALAFAGGMYMLYTSICTVLEYNF